MREEVSSPRHGSKPCQLAPHDAVASSGGQEGVAEADQPARWDLVLQADVARAVVVQVGHHPQPLGQLLRERADVRFGSLDHQVLHRLDHHAILLVGDHLGPRHLELVALAPQRLQQDRQVKLAAARHQELVGGSSVSSTRRAMFVSSSWYSRARIWREVEYLPSRPERGEVLTPRVILTVGCSISMRGRALGSLSAGDRVADVHLVQAGDDDDVAGPGLVHGYPLEPLEGEELAGPLGPRLPSARRSEPGDRPPATTPRATRPMAARPRYSS